MITFITTVVSLGVCFVLLVLTAAVVGYALDNRIQGIDLEDEAKTELRRLRRLEDDANREIRRLTDEAFDEMVTQAQRCQMPNPSSTGKGRS